MGRQFPAEHLILSFLLFAVLASCGDFIGIESSGSPDTGDLTEWELLLSDEELGILYDTVVLDSQAVCRIRKGDASREGLINIRGYSSRYMPKKSFTLEVDRIKYALDAGGDPWLQYNLAMYAYNLAGLPAPGLNPMALYLNGEYLGYYNLIKLYDEDLDDYYDTSGELFKIQLEDFAADYPIQGDSEKKFPDDNDFGYLGRLLTNVSHMGTDDWVSWVEENGDLENIARYMVVRDFLGVQDTSRLNFYIYFYSGKFMILPWDNDRGFSYTPVGGNNLLTERMLESDSFRDTYRGLMEGLFLRDNEDNILDELEEYAENLEVLLDQSAQGEPGWFLEYSAFTEEYESIRNFLSERGEDILGSSSWSEILSE